MLGQAFQLGQRFVLGARRRQRDVLFQQNAGGHGLRHQLVQRLRAHHAQHGVDVSGGRADMAFDKTVVVFQFSQGGHVCRFPKNKAGRRAGQGGVPLAYQAPIRSL